MNEPTVTVAVYITEGAPDGKTLGVSYKEWINLGGDASEEDVANAARRALRKARRAIAAAQEARKDPE